VSSENGTSESANTSSSTRERLRELLVAGKLEERIVEIETAKTVSTHLEIIGPPGMGEVEGQLKDMFSSLIPKAKERRKVAVSDARKLLLAEAEEDLIDTENVVQIALRRAEQSGIVFIDEIDKICGKGAEGKGPDVSREGVQRDLLPLVEGCTVSTKYGTVKTDHILFSASGAFHFSKPSDLMPEFQGRFPIRVELKSLTAEHFVRILTEPNNALTKQYVALLNTEQVDLTFAPDAISEIARLTAEVNSRTEDIGARRLHTLLEKLLEDLSFEADLNQGEKVLIDKAYVDKHLRDIVEDVDLSRFIL
jgi:ATP-dependent HslUV protease ATP-binding subunit HslU